MKAVIKSGESDYLTIGKEYEVESFDNINDEELGYGFKIIDDEGDYIGCLEKNCAHLNGGSWTLKDSQQ